MPLAPYDELLADARDRNYAVGAFNIFALEFLPAILEAAEEEKSPVLLQIAPLHFHMADLNPYVTYVKSQIAKTKVPVGLNMDHGKEVRLIYQALQAGFPSVMFDGSRFPYEKNLALTKRVVDICRSLGITVEAELGNLNDEGVHITNVNKKDFFTSPDEAAEFVAETGVDALAVAVGNAHGIYKIEPKLDFELLENIAKKVPVPLVLHGGSGIPDADFKKAIELGICKINIFTEMSSAAREKMKELLNPGHNPVDYVTALYETRQAVKNVVRHRIGIFGSQNKA